MLDLFFSEKILEYVMNNPKCKNKFISYLWRTALAYILLLIIALGIISIWAYRILTVQIILIYIAVTLSVSIIFPIVYWFVLKKDYL